MPTHGLQRTPSTQGGNSTTRHFAHQRRLEHEFSQPAGAFVPDPVFSACVTLSQTNAACVQPWQERHSVVLFSDLLQPRLPDFDKARVPAATARVVGIFCLSARSLRNAQACHMKCFRILPKIVVKYTHRHKLSDCIHDSMKANEMHHENICGERFIYKFTGDDVKRKWTSVPKLQHALLHFCIDTHEEHHPTHKKKSELQARSSTRA